MLHVARPNVSQKVKILYLRLTQIKSELKMSFCLPVKSHGGISRLRCCKWVARSAGFGVPRPPRPPGRPGWPPSALPTSSWLSAGFCCSVAVSGPSWALPQTVEQKNSELDCYISYLFQAWILVNLRGYLCLVLGPDMYRQVTPTGCFWYFYLWNFIETKRYKN